MAPSPGTPPTLWAKGCRLAPSKEHSIRQSQAQPGIFERKNVTMLGFILSELQRIYNTLKEILKIIKEIRDKIYFKFKKMFQVLGKNRR